MAEAGETGRLSVSEERMLRLLAEFKVELLRDLDTRFREVATTSALHAVEQRTTDALGGVKVVTRDHERRLQTLEQNSAADSAMATFWRWAVPIGVGLSIALTTQLS